MFLYRECFNAYFVHRFRATFGKVRLFTEGEKVLIYARKLFLIGFVYVCVKVLLAYSGGTNSRVLLGLAEEVCQPLQKDSQPLFCYRD